MHARPVIIDTDAGVDDALAIILALRSPEISVRAITTVAGNVEVEKCTRNVNFLLEILKVPQWPVIGPGASKPLKKALVTAPEVHGKDGLGNFGGKARVKFFKDAVTVILEQCEEFGKKLTIIALGPLTNLALALKKNPKVFRKVGNIVSMGGTFHVPGNTGPVAEFNYYVDPDAAHIVMNAGLPITVIPLDITEQVVLMRKDVQYRAKRRASVVAELILRCTKHYMSYHKRTEGFNGGYMHDPVAVAAAIWPSIVQRRKLHVDIETEGKLTRGMSIVELQRHGRSRRPGVHVATRIDRERFLRYFHERLWK